MLQVTMNVPKTFLPKKNCKYAGVMDCTSIFKKK